MVVSAVGLAAPDGLKKENNMKYKSSDVLYELQIYADFDAAQRITEMYTWHKEESPFLKKW